MKLNVKSSFARYDRRCGHVLLAVAVLTAGNLLLLWMGLTHRLYFSASLPYYAACFARALTGDRILHLLVGSFALLTCLAYAACLPSTSRGGFGLLLYGLDTVFLLAAALFLVENPLCCLPELLAHGLILLLLTPPLAMQDSKRKIC